MAVSSTYDATATAVSRTKDASLKTPPTLLSRCSSSLMFKTRCSANGSSGNFQRHSDLFHLQPYIATSFLTAPSIKGPLHSLINKFAKGSPILMLSIQESGNDFDSLGLSKYHFFVAS